MPADQLFYNMYSMLSRIDEKLGKLLTVQESEEEGRSGGQVAPISDTAEAADRIAPAPAPIPLYVVFDGPPSHESGRFVELETADGRGVGQTASGAAWTERDGLWRLGPLYGYAQEPPPTVERPGEK